MILTKDQVTFSKELVAVQVEQLQELSNVIRQVNWRLNCLWTNPETDEVWRWKLYINTDLEIPNSSSFIDYDDLDSETIMSWVVLTEEKENDYKSRCLSQFSNHITAALDIQTQNQPDNNWQGRQRI